MNAVDPIGLYGSKFSYDFGQLAYTPQEVNGEVTHNIAEYFPFSGCGPSLYQGEQCSLQFLGKNPLTVTNVSATSFTLRSRKGHGEGANKVIKFSFSESCDGDLSLTVQASGKDNWWQGWPGTNRANRAYANHEWGEFADNISARLGYRANDGYGGTFV